MCYIPTHHTHSQEILQAQGNPVDAQGDMTIKETNVRTFISRCLDKLQPHERDALVLLSLFDGDFTEQAAHAVLQPVVVQAGGAYPSETSNGMLWGFSVCVGGWGMWGVSLMCGGGDTCFWGLMVVVDGVVWLLMLCVGCCVWER